MVEWQLAHNTTVWLTCLARSLAHSLSLSHRLSLSKTKPFFSHFSSLRPLSLRCVAFIPVWCGGSFWSFRCPPSSNGPSPSTSSTSSSYPPHLPFFLSLFSLYNYFFTPSPLSLGFPKAILQFRTAHPFHVSFHFLVFSSIPSSTLLLTRLRYSHIPLLNLLASDYFTYSVIFYSKFDFFFKCVCGFTVVITVVVVIVLRMLRLVSSFVFEFVVLRLLGF